MKTHIIEFGKILSISFNTYSPNLLKIQSGSLSRILLGNQFRN